MEAAPTPSHVTHTLLPQWLQDGVNVTLFLCDMPKPRHGKLYRDTNHQWIFYPGKTRDVDKDITLFDLSATCQNLMDTGQLFKGHKKFDRVYHTQNQLQLQDSVLRHVSAHGLQSLLAPSSLRKHAFLSENDKAV